MVSCAVEEGLHDCSQPQTHCLIDCPTSQNVNEGQFNGFHIDVSVRKMFLLKDCVGLALPHSEKRKPSHCFLLFSALSRLNLAFNWIN